MSLRIPSLAVLAAALLSVVQAGGQSPSPSPSPIPWNTVVFAGTVQHLLGCSGDWDPTCLATSMTQTFPGSNIYALSLTSAVSQGQYQGKVTFNKQWNLAFPDNNFQFTVPDLSNPLLSSQLIFNGNVPYSLDFVTSLVSSCDNNPLPNDNCISLANLLHDSRNDLFHFPQGAVPANSNSTVRLRMATGVNDAQGVTLQVYSTASQSNSYYNAVKVASFAGSDYWEATVPKDLTAVPSTLYYNFYIYDGPFNVRYADDSNFDGGVGTYTNPADYTNGYAITVYDAQFKPLDNIADNVVYQIVPDRFRNGDVTNDPVPNLETRFDWNGNATGGGICTQNADGSNSCGNPDDAPRLHANWTDLPDGYCRGYDKNNNDPECTLPLNRDFFGGDFAGIQDKLSYLADLGVTMIYMTPIFEASSNHLYDTRFYSQVSHFFGNNQTLSKLVRDADNQGISIVLDGVFTDSSSDSVFFDRYLHFNNSGACHNPNSPYRNWFTFYNSNNSYDPCIATDGVTRTSYNSWYGIDSLPVYDKSVQAVRDLIYSGNSSVAVDWLKYRIGGWRLDAMPDLSYPAGFWEGFRTAVKKANPDALIIGEVWPRSDNLPKALGTTSDGTMNYRFWNAINALLGNMDVTTFVNTMLNIREDYPDAYYFSSWNLLGTHDTARILWSLTPGGFNSDDRELNATNLAQGKLLVQIARTIQFTVPGVPHIYYGDEISMTGAADPDCRRSFLWNDLSINATTNRSAANAARHWPYGAGGDKVALQSTQSLIALRQSNAAFRYGKLVFIHQNSAANTVSYLVRSKSHAAIVAVNAGSNNATLNLNVPADYLPFKTQFEVAFPVPAPHQNAAKYLALNGSLTVPVPAFTAIVLVASEDQDLLQPERTVPLAISAVGSKNVTLSIPANSRYDVVIFSSQLPGAPRTIVGTIPAPISSAPSWEDEDIFEDFIEAILDVEIQAGCKNATITVRAPANETLFYSAVYQDHAGNRGPPSVELPATAF